MPPYSENYVLQHYTAFFPMSLRKAAKVLTFTIQALLFYRVFLLMNYAEKTFLRHSVPRVLCMSYGKESYFPEGIAALRRNINLL